MGKGGYEMKRIYILAIACFLFHSSTGYAQETIQWDVAHNYYGQHLTVKGKIVSTYNSGKACFLNFHPDYKNHFTAVIFSSDFRKFPPNPENFYYGKEVEVTGYIKEYKGKPEIILKNREQIELVDGSEKVEKVNTIVSWKDAHNYYGKFITIEGQVVATYNSGKACFLNFHRNWKKYFTAVIFAKNFGKFKTPPEVLFSNKNVQVTGFVKQYKGKPEIIVKHPSQIKIIGN